MRSLYDKPVRVLMKDFVKETNITKGQIFSKSEVRNWFNRNYPKIKEGTVSAHLLRMSVNSPSRIHYNARPDDDLFFQIDSSTFRLYNVDNDPHPIYTQKQSLEVIEEDIEQELIAHHASPEFAYERDLQNYLAKNLSLIEPNLRLFEDDGINGVEFPVGGRYIDLLAVDDQGHYVVIELKVSKGYDRVVGQLLRYMAWIKQHHAEDGQKVRGIIVSRTISNDLLLACSNLQNIELFEYELSVALRKINNADGDTQSE